MQLSRLAWALALCALVACDKNSNPSAAGGGAGDAAEGGNGGAAAGPVSDGGRSAEQAGSGDGAQAGDASAGKAGRAASHAGTGGVGGTAEPQAGDGASAGQSGGPMTGGAGGEPAAGSGGAGAGAGGTSGAGGGSAAPVCMPAALCEGPKVDVSACGASPVAIDAPTTDINCPGKRTCVDAPAPLYKLTDYQGPTSCGTRATYGLDAFHGQTTLVCIFATWCEYCQAQAGKLEQLRLELHDLGKDIHIVIINEKGYSPDAFADLTYGPVLQDTPEVDAWKIHGVEKDDLLIYRADGTLEDWLQPGQVGAPIDLTKTDGYDYVKMRLKNSP
jgi:thiol-disulfide isomerase/thioredoxin